MFQKIEAREYSLIHSVSPAFPWYQPKNYNKGKLKTNFTQEHSFKNSHQNISKSNPTMYKRTVHQDQVGFSPSIQACFNIWKSVNVICHKTKMQSVKELNLSFFKIKSFCSTEVTIKRVRRQVREREKWFTKHIPDKWLLSKMYK